MLDRNRVGMQAKRAETTGGSIGDLLERIVKRNYSLLQNERNSKEKVKADNNRFGFSGRTGGADRAMGRIT
jgi:hypothetical protein